jgi:hypothetical protein
MGLWDEWGVSLCSDELFFTLILTTTIRVGQLNKYFLLEASEEVVATVLFVLSTPNAMPLLTQRHRPNHGALLFRLTAKK